jgi:hypothetical protein
MHAPARPGAGTTRASPHCLGHRIERARQRVCGPNSMLFGGPIEAQSFYHAYVPDCAKSQKAKPNPLVEICQKHPTQRTPFSFLLKKYSQFIFTYHQLFYFILFINLEYSLHSFLISSGINASNSSHRQH